jgi:ComF family protein
MLKIQGFSSKMLLDLLLSLFAPHLCQGCGATGRGLCECCNNYIIDEIYPFCLICGLEISYNNLCVNCRKTSSITRAFVVGQNKTTLKRLLYAYKFTPARGLSRDLSHLLDRALPILPSDTIIVPIPTISKHIRQRGFGHIELIARQLARRRRLPYRQLLLRRDNSVQHGLNAAARAQSAAKTFRLRPKSEIARTVLLIDDIYTTGQTIKAASKLLKSAGARTIYVAVIARQTR